MKHFIHTEDGAAVAEYAMLAAILTVTIVLAINTFSSTVTTAISNSSTMIPTG